MDKVSGRFWRSDGRNISSEVDFSFALKLNISFPHTVSSNTAAGDIIPIDGNGVWAPPAAN
jgi:hypothetical protein